MGKVKRVKAPQELGIEAFLAKRNLERVEVVNDGSCLFRAVAFQVSHIECNNIRFFS